MIEQFRHGSNTVELEIPGGIIDARDASPRGGGRPRIARGNGLRRRAAANHRLDLSEPGHHEQHLLHRAYVKNCRLQHPVEWDHGEDMVTRLVPVADIPKLVAGGQIRHSLVVVALYHFELLRQKG